MVLEVLPQNRHAPELGTAFQDVFLYREMKSCQISRRKAVLAALKREVSALAVFGFVFEKEFRYWKQEELESRQEQAQQLKLQPARLGWQKSFSLNGPPH